MIFELITGDFLFEPRNGHSFAKDDDHLAQMMELLGRIPKDVALSGKKSKRFFDQSGHLRCVRGLQYWPLDRVLVEKYRIKEDEAKRLTEFLTPMLLWDPAKRASAESLLEHPWLSMEPLEEYKMTDEEFKYYQVCKENNELATNVNEGTMSELDVYEEALYGADLDSTTDDIENLNLSFNDSDDLDDLGYEIEP